MYGLTSEELNSVINMFLQCQHVERVLLFGSRAKGCYKPFSDVDLCIEGEDVTNDDIVSLKWQIDDLLLPYRFDLLVRQDVNNEELLNHIDRVGKVIYKRIDKE